MEKLARSKSADPIQEALREAKATWNKSVSEFIDDLIHSKKMLNGHPSKFYNEKSKIISPLPADPASILGVLASDFQEITSKGLNIIKQQEQYSVNRKQPVVKAADLKEIERELIALGSSRASRFVSRLSRPWIGKGSGSNKFRIQLLNGAVEMQKSLIQIKKLVIGFSKEDLFAAEKIFNQLNSKYGALNTLDKQLAAYVSAFVGNEELTNSDLSEQDLETYKRLVETFRLYQHDFQNNMQAKTKLYIPVMEHFNDYQRLQEKAMKAISFYYSSDKHLTVKDKIINFQKFIILYNEIFQFVKNDISKKVNASEANTFKDLSELVANYQEKAEQVKEAGIIDKTKSLVHKFVPFVDKLSSSKLAIYDHVNHSLELVDKLLNILEKQVNYEEILEIINRLKVDFIQIERDFYSIMSFLKARNFDDSYLDLIKKQRLFGENIDLDEDIEKDLKRKLYQRRLQELLKPLSYNKEKDK